ncbi:G/U mismatch-specific uracil-DNA glycosylase [Luteibacter sp. UNC138MFCol5.1]|uniref:mismatch-specific DNA-glycosylase n=1 Tax=Luteibacter sp. UNC138MFCol5.1 TaxID=1502774 RepID=UPI0008AF8D5A|nr:mismatch-specific DNA-glycosylase [Luteibacter sp. UNC138MFCol5.1]SEO55848.1 G/U mismatch-specific uracil-DNA glycosylase [Luteibacter sp. UNC138MFCol5.1]
MPTPAAADGFVLPDLLEPGLRLVFCGTAAGTRSAREGAYYAHPGNMFWRTLFATGLTPRLLDPAEYPLLTSFGIGLTDLSKFHYGNDAELPVDAFDVAALEARIRRVAPGAIAFTSKHGGVAALGKGIGYGAQPATFAGVPAYVLPSPSGQARRSWDVGIWQALADAVRAQLPGVDR